MAAPVFESVNSAKGTAVSSLTFSLTTTGSDRCLIVDAGCSSGGPGTVNSVTYNSIGATNKWNIIAQIYLRASQWYLPAPATGGSYNVVVTYSGTHDESFAGARNYTGVDQTTPTGTATTANGLSGTAAVNVGSATGELVVDFVYENDNTAMTCGQTQRWQLNDAGTGYASAGGSEKAGETTTAMAWTLGASDRWINGGFALKPAAGGVTGTISTTLSGVTSSIAGKVRVAGNISTTLAGVTSSVAGRVAVSGVIATSLSGVTSAIAGKVRVSGTIGATLAGVTSNLVGTVGSSAISGTIAASLAGVTSSLTGRVRVTGNISTTLAGVTSAISSRVAVQGAIGSTLSGVTSALSGRVRVTGVIGATLSGVTANLTSSETGVLRMRSLMGVGA